MLDEFTYAIKSERKILSDLQRVWDHVLGEKNVMLVVSGPMLGMMWDDVLSHTSPLHGRRTRSINLRPLDYRNAVKFFGEKETGGIISYMLVGGIPPYLRLASRYESVEEFLREEFLSDYGFFYNEPYVLLSEELREPKGYFSILRAIAEGNTRLERIANYVGIPMKSVYPYVENLLRLGLVEREKPPLLGDRKVSLYRIRDPMLLTWFTLTYPQLEAMATGTAALDDLYRVLSRRFEDLAREFLVIKRPFEFERLGRWWFKGEEIDVVAVEKDTAHLIEVKWEELGERDARRIIGDLERKSRMVRFNGEFRFGIIARRIEGKDELREEGFPVFDLEDF